MLGCNVLIEEDVVLGKNVQVWHNSIIRRGARIGKNTSIGSGVYIGEGVVIGNGCKIQNGAQIFHGVKIKDNVFIGPHVVFTNDKHPDATPGRWAVRNTVVHDGVSIGANATVVCGIIIYQDAMVAAGAVVTKCCKRGRVYAGNPAKFLKLRSEL